MVKVFDLTLRLSLALDGPRPEFKCSCDEIPTIWFTGKRRHEIIGKTKAGALTVLAHRLRESEMPDLEVVTVELVDETGGQGGGSSGSVQGEGEQRESEESG